MPLKLDGSADHTIEAKTTCSPRTNHLERSQRHTTLTRRGWGDLHAVTHVSIALLVLAGGAEAKYRFLQLTAIPVPTLTRTKLP